MYKRETVYIGVVGPEEENGICRDSQLAIIKRQGDSQVHPIRATKGYEARQLHLDRWYEESTHDYLFLMDHDQAFEPETLEQLRDHKLPFVSGLYMRRRHNPIAPVWFKLPPKGVWPMEPWVTKIERGRLHKLGGSGWGCMLLHRDVVTATKLVLKGELEIIEDDMDIWPYDLHNVFSALRDLEGKARSVEDIDPRTIEPAIETLANELRLLRGNKNEIVGSDLRFPFYAREAGFTLMGDPDVRPSHNLNYPLRPDDFDTLPEGYFDSLNIGNKKRIRDARKNIQQNLNKLKGMQ